MRRNELLSYIFMIVVLMACSNNGSQNTNSNDIVIENEQFKLTIGSDAITKSLILKSTNEECLMPGEKIAIFSVTQERPYHNEIKLAHPNKKTTFQANAIHREGDRLIVGFELVPWEAVIQIKETSAYVGFSFECFKVDPDDYPEYLKITPPPATELRLLQLPVRSRKYFGEWLNVSWDNNVAINVLATDEYANIDFEKRTGYHLLTATVIKDIKFEGTGTALIVSHPDKLLDNIAQLEEDFNLPKGVESRRCDVINASYFCAHNINPDNVDQHIKYAKMGGIRLMQIYYPSFEGFRGYNFIGDYEIDRKLYPNGKDDLRKMLDKIKAAGITPGVHFLHPHIGRDSKYVTPIPDHRLNLTKMFTLSENLGRDDTEVFVEQNPEGTVMAEGCRVLKVGTEYISYEGFTTARPYKFTGCKRGNDNTTINSQPRGTIIGIVDVSEFGATSIYIDQRTSLQDEIAEKIGNIYDAGFQFMYFDGSEGVNPPFGHNIPLAQYRVYKCLKPAPLFSEGAAKAHFSWHMLSGGNAFDSFAPEVIKEKTRNWPAEEAPRMRQDFTRINFGRLGYWLPSEETIGTQPDMWEYVASVSVAWDCPLSIHLKPHDFEAHVRAADNLEVLRRWEDVRAQKWLSEEQKKMLQNVDREHHLLINEQNQFELVPYEQIINVAGGSKEIRAFIFQRKGDYYVVYWHISDNKKLELPFNTTDVKLYLNMDKEENIISGKENSVLVPVDSRRYLKLANITKEQAINAFKNAKIVN